MAAQKRWWVSPYNYINEVTRQFSLPQKVLIYDVTLRDGEQTPGVVLSKEDKISIAKALDDIGVPRIEAGMPVISQEDKETVKEIAKMGLHAQVWGFCRALKTDIDACIDCGVDAVVTEIASSDLKLKAYDFKREDVIQRALEAVTYAKEHGLYTAFFAVDATRADLDYLKQLYTTVVNEGHADEVVIPDTLGVTLPEAMEYLTKKVKEWVNVPVHVHCHNDFGLAPACTLAAVKAGAEIVHTTINGIGEKAGNTDMAEVALSLYILYGIDVKIKYDKLIEISKLVEKLSGQKVADTKPVVGPNVFKRESGVVVLQLLNYPPAVESFSPEIVGATREIVLGKKSGKHSIGYKLNEMKMKATEDQISAILSQVKELSLKKKGPVTDDEFRNIVKNTVT